MLRIVVELFLEACDAVGNGVLFNLNRLQDLRNGDRDREEGDQEIRIRVVETWSGLKI
jgi:hypothetical protein